MDKNSNGTIDNGRELFGDAFIKSNGQTAVDGFDALRDLDSNGNGKIDSGDAQFGNLRVWRDLNQNGTTQANRALRHLPNAANDYCWRMAARVQKSNVSRNLLFGAIPVGYCADL